MPPHVYLDYAATSPLRPEVRAAMERAWNLDAANPSAMHRPAQAQRALIEESRERVATALGVSAHEIVFTSGGTEADNLAVIGIARAAAPDRRHVVVSAIEHPAVLEPARALAASGDVELTVVSPRTDGIVDPDRVLEAVRPDTALVSVMTVNNELGSVNDVSAIVEALAESPTVVHSDAVQALATVGAPPADALSLTAHKVGGPVGVGVAVLRRGVPVAPILHGGGQERGLRPGTLPTALIAACAEAVVLAVDEQAGHRDRSEALTGRLVAALKPLAGWRRNGPADAAERSGHVVHLSIDGIDGEALAFMLDSAGVAVSTGSACASGAAAPSHVLQACGVAADAVLRLSVGRGTTDDEVDRAAAAVVEAVTELRGRGGGFVELGAADPTGAVIS